MRFKKRYFSEVKKKVVTYLSESQFGVSCYESKFGKRIPVLHYYEPGCWNMYVELLDPTKGPTKKNRIIWYPYNFKKIEKPTSKKRSKSSDKYFILKGDKKYVAFEKDFDQLIEELKAKPVKK